MKTMALAFLFMFSVFSAKTSIYDYKLEAIKGDPIDFAKFKARPVLLVNIATQCGYTPQLEGLQKIYDKYKNKGLVVIGAPSNDFKEQTPEENQEVAKFCKLNYEVNFPLSKKVSVKGKDQHPLFKRLTQGKEISWNFEKFIIDREGKLSARFGSKTGPDSKEFISALEKTL